MSPARRRRAWRGAALAAVLGLGACAAEPPPALAPSLPDRVAARTPAFLVIRRRPGETDAELAAEYLGDASRADRIASLLEAERGGRTGGAAVVSLQPRDPGGTLQSPAEAVPVICYHRFTARPQPRSKLEVTATSFERQLQFLRENGYHVVPLARLAAFLDGAEDLPAKPVVITVDDGYRSFYDVAFPILRRFSDPATVFIYSSFVGGDALTPAEKADLARSPLISFQGHSKTHPDLTRRQGGESREAYLSRVKRELELNVPRVEDQTLAFAYPYGAADERVLSLMAGSPWRLGLTVLRGPNPSWADPLLLRREMIFGTDSLEVFARRLAEDSRAEGL
jgi:peptidoglycan/xylan/chitin deacetylase (PgdA/CDA1 family)